MMLMLCLARNLDESRKNAREGRFHHPFADDLYGRTLALIGFGASGRELARRAAAFGMRLLAIDTVPITTEDRDRYGLSFAESPEHLEYALAESDYISLHTPLTSETAGMLDRRRIALLKPTAAVINVARGPLIDEQALIEALAAGRLRGAGLDVFATEPLGLDHPLLKLENVVATPHVAGGSRETSHRRGAAVAENVLRVLDGRPILHEIIVPAPSRS
jgi:phosphoglycerate dehydrogenase-like enzyme